MSGSSNALLGLRRHGSTDTHTHTSTTTFHSLPQRCALEKSLWRIPQLWRSAVALAMTPRRAYSQQCIVLAALALVVLSSCLGIYASLTTTHANRHLGGSGAAVYDPFDADALELGAELRERHRKRVSKRLAELGYVYCARNRE